MDDRSDAELTLSFHVAAVVSHPWALVFHAVWELLLDQTHSNCALPMQ